MPAPAAAAPSKAAPPAAAPSSTFWSAATSATPASSPATGCSSTPIPSSIPDQFCASAKSLAAHLAGLCLILEHGTSAAAGAAALRAWLDGPRALDKPSLPADRGALTLADLAGIDEPAGLARRRCGAGPKPTWDAYHDLQPLARDWVAAAMAQHPSIWTEPAKPLNTAGSFSPKDRAVKLHLPLAALLLATAGIAIAQHAPPSAAAPAPAAAPPPTPPPRTPGSPPSSTPRSTSRSRPTRSC